MTKPVIGTVYIIHFEKKYYHAQHYVGFTVDLDERIKKHKSGNGSCLMRAVSQAGIGWVVARVWKEKTGHFERKLKKKKNTNMYCPICSKKLLDIKED